MKWSDFRQAVLDLITVDARRLGLEKYVERLIVLGVDEIQYYVEYYRRGHVKVYHSDDATPDGETSKVKLPPGAFLRQFEMFGAADSKSRVPLDYYSYSNLEDLRNRRMATPGSALYTVDPQNRFAWVAPALSEDRVLRVTFDLKTAGSFGPDDETPFDEDMAFVVAEYMKWKITREVDRNLKIAADYKTSYLEGRAKLFIQAKERGSERVVPSMASAPVEMCLPVPIVSCPPSYPSYEGSCCGTLIPVAPYCCPCPPRVPPADHIVLFGDSGQSWNISATERVAEVVNGLNPDVIIQLGDASYGVGTIPGGYDTLIPENFLQFYFAQHREHLFMTFGNHDLEWDYGRKFIDRLPALKEAIQMEHGDNGYKMGRWWYAIQQQFVTFFVLNSGLDGDTYAKIEEQKAWLKESLANTGTPWKVVVFHRAPFCSDISHAPGEGDMRWPFKEWGAHLVISGHAHNYERLRVDGLDYLVCGTGGGELRDATTNSAKLPVDGNGKPVSIRFLKQFGCLQVIADPRRLHAEFTDLDGQPQDRLRIVA